MTERLPDILDEHQPRRSEPALRALLRQLTTSLGVTLGSETEITRWTLDPACADNGVDVRFSPCDAAGCGGAGIVAFLHDPGRCAHATAILLGFDEHGTRVRPHQEFVARLTTAGWWVLGWGADANYEWESYTDDMRWR